MGTPLRALIVEDLEDDALLLVRELKRGGYEPFFERVDTPEAMSAALADGPWDIVFSDYALPHFSAPAALALFTESGLDVPFIIVSGAIGESAAVELMKAGAHDYVMKDNLARLLPAVQRELGEAEGRRQRRGAEVRLRESEERFRLLFESSPDGIAQIDTEGRFVTANPGMAKSLGIPSVEELIGKTCSEVMPQDIAERRLRLIRKAYEEEQAQIFEDEREGRYFHNIFVPIKIPGREEKTVQVISRDITERRKAEQQLARSFVVLAETVSRAMASRDPYTAGHERRVAELARLVGQKMGLDENTLMGLYIGGLLHDIGKIATPESILSKSGELIEEEWSLLRAHAKRGYDILKHADLPWPVADMTLHHHERLDGSGYPHGISGERLSLEVRILGVCDVVEAMISHRPYRPARSREQVIQEIETGRGTKYDARVVDVMLEIVEREEFDFGAEGNSSS